MSVYSCVNLELPSPDGPRIDLQDQPLSLVSASAQKKNYNTLSTGIYSRIFTFLDLADIAHCPVNKQTSQAVDSSYLSQEKLKQINLAAWERLSSLNRFDIQINWRVNLRQEAALRKINRDLAREENQMQQLENAQPAMTLKAQTRLQMSLDASKAMFCVFIMTIVGRSPTGDVIDISPYTP